MNGNAILIVAAAFAAVRICQRVWTLRRRWTLRREKAPVHRGGTAAPPHFTATGANTTVFYRAKI